MSRTNSISAVDALGTFIDTLRDLGYTPDEVKGALIFYASPMSALPPPGRGMVPMTEIEIASLRQAHGITSDGRGIKEFTKVVSFVRAVEAHHGIKEGSATPLGDGEGAR